jgi:diadenylate cyclase
MTNELLNTLLFIEFRLLDLIDILVVAFLIYQLYRLVKGTVAINIFFGIIAVYTLWLIVKALNMQLLESILGQFISVGVIALMIVFQQELRRFLLLIGSSSMINQFKESKIFKSLRFGFKENYTEDLQIVANACAEMSRDKLGALIVMQNNSALDTFIQTGEKINAKISKQLLLSIFFKNSPLHDGAVIICKHTIAAAKCILPVSEKNDLPPDLGMRHRAGLGVVEITDAICIIVSEQTGNISVAHKGKLFNNIDEKALLDFLNSEYHN